MESVIETSFGERQTTSLSRTFLQHECRDKDHEVYGHMQIQLTKKYHKPSILGLQ